MLTLMELLPKLKQGEIWESDTKMVSMDCKGIIIIEDIGDSTPVDMYELFQHVGDVKISTPKGGEING